MIHHVSIACELPADGWFFVIRDQGSLAVSIFFVLSGLLLSRPFWQAALLDKPVPGFRKYALARMTRILPAYYVCVLVSALVFYDAHANPISRLVSSLAFVNWMHWRTFYPTPGNSALWSIGVEVAFYLLLPLWALGLRRIRSLWGGLAFVALSQLAIMGASKLACAYVFASQGGVSVSDPLQLEAYERLPAKNPLSLFSHFLFGCAAAAALVEMSRRSRPAAPGRWNGPNWGDAASAICLLLVCLEIYPAIIGSPIVSSLVGHAQIWFLSYQWPLFPALVALLLVALQSSAWIGPLLDNRFLRWTAQLSYGIYLWHEVVLRLLKPIWPAPVTEAGTSRMAYTFVVIILTYSVSMISFRFIERPALDWLKRRSRAGTTPVSIGRISSMSTAASMAGQ